MLLNASGQISLLRVHDLGTGYGPPSDSIDVEVVVQFVGRPADAFGFQLRSDNKNPARRGMLDLLRDAFNHAWTANTDDWKKGTVSKWDTVTVRELARYFTVTCNSLPTGSSAACDGKAGCCAMESVAVMQHEMAITIATVVMSSRRRICIGRPPSKIRCSLKTTKPSLPSLGNDRQRTALS